MRAFLTKNAITLNYVACRAAYVDVYEGKTGKVIGYAATGKVAIEFDTPVFINQDIRISSHNNGCHGKGKINYCWYFPKECLIFVDDEKQIIFEKESTNELLLLL